MKQFIRPSDFTVRYGGEIGVLTARREAGFRTERALLSVAANPIKTSYGVNEGWPSEERATVRLHGTQ